MYRALVRFAQRWQAKLQHGRFVAGAGKRGCGADAIACGAGARPGRRPGRRAPRAAGRTGRCAPRSGCRTPWPGRRTTWCVSPGPRAACTMRLTSDSGPPISMSAGTSRSPMWRVDDVGLGREQQLFGQAADRADRELAVDQQERILRSRRGLRRMRRPAIRGRSACTRATRAGCRPAPAGGRSGRRNGRLGGSDLRGPEGRRDVGVRSRGFHLTAVIRLCDVVFSRSGHPPRPAIEDV